MLSPIRRPNLKDDFNRKSLVYGIIKREESGGNWLVGVKRITKNAEEADIRNNDL